MTDRTDQAALADALLDMTYGELVSMGDALSNVIVNIGGVDVSKGMEVAAALHEWAVEVNDRRQTND